MVAPGAGIDLAKDVIEDNLDLDGGGWATGEDGIVEGDLDATQLLHHFCAS